MRIAIALLFPLLILTGCEGEKSAGRTAGELPPDPREAVESPPLAAGAPGPSASKRDAGGASPQPAATRPRPRPRPPARRVDPRVTRVVAGARKELSRKKKGYDAAYFSIDYPGGDVPGPGVCTDLLIRALRAGGHDLQKLVHEDKKADLDAYPRLWDRHAPDTNIDHRRVPNLMCFFKRKGGWLSTSTRGPELATWRPGDLVFWDLGANGRKHCGVISDRRAKSGRPLVIHNISGAAEEDCLTRWTIIGHARYLRPRTPAKVAKKTGRAPAADDDEPKG